VKTVFVEQIRERDWVDAPFLVREKITAMARNGKPYLTLKLVDRSGEVEGRVWDRVDEIADRFEKNDFVKVQGKASVYLGKMQLVVQDLQRIKDQEVEMADFLPVSKRDVAEMVRELKEVVAGLADPHLRGLMEAFLADNDFLQAFQTAPAAKTMHHVYIGGLLEHSLAVAGLADDICRRYSGFNRDLLVTGALLHDIGKVEELSYRRTFEYTDAGKLLGHVVIGTEMVEEKLRSFSDFPPVLGTLLKHLLLSHHGQYEYGSPKRPKTLEAVVLNFLDDLDSKINGVRTHIDREPDNAASWTSYHRFYDRYFFKDGLAGQPEIVPAPAVKQPEPEPPPQSAADGTAKKAPEKKEGRRGFGFTLGDQLKDKSLELFGPDDQQE